MSRLILTKLSKNYSCYWQLNSQFPVNQRSVPVVNLWSMKTLCFCSDSNCSIVTGFCPDRPDSHAAPEKGKPWSAIIVLTRHNDGCLARRTSAPLACALTADQRIIPFNHAMKPIDTILVTHRSASFSQHLMRCPPRYPK